MRESREKKGDPPADRFIFHAWLVMLGGSILLINLLRVKHHHHQAGPGFLALLSAYTGAIVLTWLRTKRKKGKLYDKTEKASRRWAFLSWGGPISAAIITWLAGAPGGIGVLAASIVYFVIMAAEIMKASVEAAQSN